MRPARRLVGVAARRCGQPRADAVEADRPQRPAGREEVHVVADRLRLRRQPRAARGAGERAPGSSGAGDESPRVPVGRCRESEPLVLGREPRAARGEDEARAAPGDVVRVREHGHDLARLAACDADHLQLDPVGRNRLRPHRVDVEEEPAAVGRPCEEDERAGCAGRSPAVRLAHGVDRAATHHDRLRAGGGARPSLDPDAGDQSPAR